MEGPTPSQQGWRSALFDWGPVVGVAAVSQAGIGLEHPWPATSLELALTGLATALPLGWRRTRPIPVAALIGLVLVAQVHVVDGSLHFGSFAAAVIAMYSLARHTREHRSAVGGGTLLGAEITVAMAGEILATPEQVVFPLFYFIGTWLLGRGMRTLHERTVQLQQLNAALERDRESRAQLAVADERLRLARELHDVVAHTVMLMVVQAEAAEETIDTDPGATRRSLGAVQDAGRRGMDDLRNLVGVLRAPQEGGVDDLPGLTALESLCDRMRGSGLAVRLTMGADPSGIARSVQAAAFRVVQEALTNVLKHSAAAEATVRVAVDHDLLTVVVTDPGPARPGRSGGHGLSGMRERVELHHGRLTTGPRGEGFSVAAELPFRVPVP